jgi:hypothetical protein
VAKDMYSAAQNDISYVFPKSTLSVSTFGLKILENLAKSRVTAVIASAQNISFKVRIPVRVSLYVHTVYLQVILVSIFYTFVKIAWQPVASMGSF